MYAKRCNTEYFFLLYKIFIDNLMEKVPKMSDFFSNFNIINFFFEINFIQSKSGGREAANQLGLGPQPA